MIPEHSNTKTQTMAATKTLAKKSDEKRQAVFKAALEVFSQYGFRRTAMNDIAQSAGISRPALYLIFDNKEDLFRQLVTSLQDEAILQAVQALDKQEPLPARIVSAILAYENIYYVPVSKSRHGAELMDASQSLAADDMKKGHGRLIAHLAKAISAAASKGEADLAQMDVKPQPFAELLMWSVSGQKKAATSTKDFQRRIREVSRIFMKSIEPK
jgi:AcrR family transcriptional regulator